MVRLYATIAHAAVLCGMLLLFIGGIATQQQGPPAHLPGWRPATPAESLIHQLEQRRAIEEATRP